VSAPLRIDERIGAYVRGANYLDERLGALMQPLEDAEGAADDEALPPSQRASVDAAVAGLGDAVGDEPPPMLRVQLVGADPATRRTIARVVGTRIGKRPLLLGADRVPGMSDVDAFTRLWERERRLLPLALVIELPDADLSSEAPAELADPRTRLLRIAAGASGVVLVGGREPVVDALPESSIVDVRRPTHDEQAAIWRDALGDEYATAADELAAQFSLSAAAIRAIALRHRGGDPDPQAVRDRMWTACARHSRPALTGLAQHIEAHLPWSALKLPEREAATLARLRYEKRARANDRAT
jgi:hypothetical protein